MNMHHIKKAVHWGLAIIVFLELISGLGILYYRIVEMLTFGILTKARSFVLHNYLTVPFIVVLALHLYFTLWGKRGKK